MRLAPALPPGCPWSGFTPPNVDWCEREACAWIVNPAEAWSNVAYLLGALAMWRLARTSSSGDLAHFAPASLAVGAFSFAYHASYTWLLQFFDFVGMFVFCFLVLARNAVRLGWIAPQRERAAWLAGTVAASACVPPLFYAGVPIQATVFVLILGSVAQELALFRRRDASASYASYWAALALLAAASAFSLADVTRAWCDPESWLQGHALWHVLSAAALVSLQRFYAAQPRP
ncbi:MAG: ceramidase domain-containing protein [Deltaproteobacteria bacterium]|nr:ceramidase domain-containing protein [Deltaproteobacteria bacterium]